MFRFSRSSGAFFGTVFDSSADGRYSFSGVVLQSLGSGFGFLLGGHQSSQVSVQVMP
jgi:hypothetical protein